MSHEAIRVLVVDDSPVVRKVLSSALLEDPSIVEVETAATGPIALHKINKHDPHVVTLDVEMPVQDGLETLQQIMATCPRPVIMVSAATNEGAAKTIRAQELGAVDFIPKPVGRLSRDVAAIGAELRKKAKAVARLARGSGPLGRRHTPAAAGISPRPSSPLPSRVREYAHGREQPAIVALGASTGGVTAIREVLEYLPRDFPAGVVVVQHMPGAFTGSFAKRLNEVVRIGVKEASQHDLVLPGRALLAPGHSHMTVVKGEHGVYVELNRSQEVSGHRPSVDVLFESVAKTFGGRAVGVLLTGMGRDGATGLRLMRQSGALTLAQQQDSCVVYGMPKAAVLEGGAEVVADLRQIGEALCATALCEFAPGVSISPRQAEPNRTHPV